MKRADVVCAALYRGNKPHRKVLATLTIDDAPDAQLSVTPSPGIEADMPETQPPSAEWLADHPDRDDLAGGAGTFLSVTCPKQHGTATVDLLQARSDLLATRNATLEIAVLAG